MEPIFYNPLDPRVHADPYPHYRQLREADPVHRSALGFWVLSRYRDIAYLLRDPRLGHELSDQEEFGLLSSAEGASMLFRDPPAHTRLRALVSKAFTPRMLESWRGRIHQIVSRSVERAKERGEIDVIADLAFPLPATVICEMLGLPTEDQDQCRRWTNALTKSLDPVMSAAEADELGFAAVEFRDYLAGRVSERRDRPGEDLMTALIAAREQGDRLSQDELISTISLLFVAGHETTTNLIGNGLLALLRNPDQLRRLRGDPSLLRNAVEEVLRYDSPVQFVVRTVKQPIDLEGDQMAPGDPVLLLVAASNRDPAQFKEPDVLDLGRRDIRHLSFGGGIHFCLGSVLARMEGQIALGALVSNFDRLEIASDRLEWRPHINLRGLESLPLEVGRSGG
ncbi:MAG: cytochrome P450 [Actinomycetota bacterium]